jgi:hypothetical protein
MADLLHDQIEVLKDAARSAGSIVVDTVLNGHDGDSVLTAGLNAEEFIKVMWHCRPKIVYIHATRFEALADTLVAMDIEEADEEEVAGNSQVKALVKKWKSHEGEVSTLLGAFVVDGVLHVSMRQPDWVDIFEAEAEGLGDALSEEARVASARMEQEARSRIRDLAVRLCDHPKFNGPPRPSKEKRAFLAREMFPDVEEYMIRLIVDEATNLEFVR